jgi:hypothetical protein
VTPFDRTVRAQVYRHIVASGVGPTAGQLAETRGWDPEEVTESLRRLGDEHLIATTPGEPRVMMAHPFSGVETGYTATVGGRTWYANCAWDALAVLALMGDGEATMNQDGHEAVWVVKNGQVSPTGVIHLRVPARDFWDDIVFT